MKKKRIIRKFWWAFIPGVMMLLVIWLFFPKDMRADAHKRLEDARADCDQTTLDIRYDDSLHTLAVTQTMYITNRTRDDFSSIVLRTWANAWQTEMFSPAAIDEWAEKSYPDGFQPGGLQLDGIWWQDKIILPEYLDDAMTVLSVPAFLKSGETGTLLMRYTVFIPRCSGRFGYDDHLIRLDHVFPALSVYENSMWNQDEISPFGNAFRDSCVNYSVSLTLPDGYTPLCCSEIEKTDGRFHAQLPAARGCSMVFVKDLAKKRAVKQGVSIASYAMDEKSASQALRSAQSAVDALSRRFGDAPYDFLTLVACSLPFDGYSAPGLVVFDQDASSWDVVRLIAMQWFGILVGSDGSSDPWLSESIAQWAMLMAAHEIKGQGTFESLKQAFVDEAMMERMTDITPGSPAGHFRDSVQFDAVARGRACGLWFALDEMTGQVNQCLAMLCQDFAFRFLSRTQLTGFLRETLGQDVEPLMIDYLDTYMTP